MSSQKIPNKCILLNKGAGETSFQSLGKIKRDLATGKVGHTGTLDKFARGLMVVLSGKLTRLNPLFTGMDKSYIAEIHFGAETETLDPEGALLYQAPVPEFSTLEKILPRFMGPQEQIPPLFSAIHVDGKRAWKRALEGEEIEMKPRKIEIYSLEILKWESPKLVLKVDCSKGTYIRSLARDLGLACDSRAYLTDLCRTTVGPFHLDMLKDQERMMLDAWQLADFLPDFRRVIIHDELAQQVALGRHIEDQIPEGSLGNSGFCGLYNSQQQLLAVIRFIDNKSSYLFVVPPDQVN